MRHRRGYLHPGLVHLYDSFLGADLHDDSDQPRSLHEAVDRLERFTDEVTRAGWFCRFYSRLSLADRLYLAAALDIQVADEDDSLLAVCHEFHPQISLFLFRTDTEGLCEFIVMPWEGADVKADAMIAAANDVLSNLVQVVAWDPHEELRRYVDEL
jgi:hypothetical protein